MNYPDDFINKIICGDCIEVMKGMPDNSIDTIITDAPYELNFMSKGWDRTGVAFQVSTWQEVLRVAKPGATLLCFGGTRTFHRLACAIEDAGWIIKDCIMYMYGSGFPKASDISQILDKDECRKQLEEKLGRKPTKEEFKKAWEGFRKVIGSKCMHYPDTENWSNKSNAYTDNSNATVKIAPGTYGENFTRPITAPATPEATLWNGWKSHGLKPAYEPILLCVKPNEGSYANNALKWGVAGLNIDGGRISCNLDKEDLSRGRKSDNNTTYFTKKNADIHLYPSPQGRFPANIILDEESARMLDEMSGNTSITGKRKNPLKSYHQPEGGEWFGRHNHNGAEYQDTGGASRFFYCAKASKSERNRGCENLYWLDGKFTTKEIYEKLDKENEENKDNKNFKRHNIARGNIHPTVKSLALMIYLVKLTLMPNKDQIYLDNFCGSGTTAMACKETGRKYIAIDNDKEYVEIAQCRVGVVEPVLI